MRKMKITLTAAVAVLALGGAGVAVANHNGSERGFAKADSNGDGDSNTLSNGIGCFRDTKLRFGHQLEDVESVLSQQLAEKPVHGRIRGLPSSRTR